MTCCSGIAGDLFNGGGRTLSTPGIYGDMEAFEGGDISRRPGGGWTRVDLVGSLVLAAVLVCFGCAGRPSVSSGVLQVPHTAMATTTDRRDLLPEASCVARPSSVLSISEAVRIALRNNPDLAEAVARIRQSEAMIAEAEARFWPTLSAYAEYVQGDAPSGYLFKAIDQRKLPSPVDFNHPGWFENYETGVMGRINLFNGGRDLLGMRMQEAELRIRELDQSAVENTLVASVIETFYDALASEQFIKIAQESVKTVETQLRIMRVRLKAGGALKSDVLSLEVRLAEAREALLLAQNRRSLTGASLANLLGWDPDTEIVLSDTAGEGLKLPKDYQSGLIKALAYRPELERARRRLVQSRMAVDMARSEYLPRIDVEGKVYVDDPLADFNEARKNWTAGVVLNWEFFSGLGTRARVRKAEGVLDALIAIDRKTTLSVKMDLKTAYLKLEEAKARLAVTRAAVAQAEESLALVERQYQGGSATITRYLEAELARNRAKIRATAAFFDREKAAAAVGRALGYWRHGGMAAVRK
ncbi:MAG: TolC family protein [Deltaproteobacteria bacterium]|nr:TolC family protein [Deltaproteobacteria bacterium]